MTFWVGNCDRRKPANSQSQVYCVKTELLQSCVSDLIMLAQRLLGKYSGFTNPLVRKIHSSITCLQKNQYLFEEDESPGCNIFRIHRSSGWGESRRWRFLEMSAVRVRFVLESCCVLFEDIQKNKFGNELRDKWGHNQKSRGPNRDMHKPRRIMRIDVLRLWGNGIEDCKIKNNIVYGPFGINNRR